ncbi:T9SS type A sorting domain-containing protein [uncultured Bacteroides sp.]|uniref:T9SS type A sorting domain-containing protein n=1 Tax=uncultured Bacteroides sp. TaxID=162156 RepID=UPI002AAB4B3F|nr:T9SS type A sorting domain-containing protein [uncultured Bacteroides sp.]
MKTHFTLLLLLCGISYNASAQNSIPNASFENWNSTSYEVPSNYLISSNNRTFQKLGIFNIIKTADSYQGTSAVKLTTLSSENDTIGAYLANSSSDLGPDPSTWQGGIPYNQRPTGVKGYYKCNITYKDSALIGIVLKKSGSLLAFKMIALGGLKTDYTPFEFSIPTLTQDPDTIIFVATSSNLMKFNGIPGSTITLDNISLLGVSSQPDLLNGDFEEWTTQQTPLIPTGWNSDEEGLSAVRAIDKYDGQYALELRTLKFRDDNGEYKASTGWAQIGTWNDATQSFTNGFPCNKQNDILTFYYKYTPTVTGSKATANINLNKNGRQVGGMWMELEATNTYKYFEVPFSTMEIPDEASISFQSNNNETLSLNDVGSVLKVDKLAFKSELTNIPESKANNESVKLYPMPFKTSCTLEINPTLDISGMQLSIYNSAGSLVRQDKITNYQTTIYKGNLVSGTYLLEVIKDKATIFNKKIIVE